MWRDNGDSLRMFTKKVMHMKNFTYTPSFTQQFNSIQFNLFTKLQALRAVQALTVTRHFETYSIYTQWNLWYKYHSNFVCSLDQNQYKDNI